MTRDKLKKIFILMITIYTALVVSFYFLAEKQLRYKPSPNNVVMLEEDSLTEEIKNGIVITQIFQNNMDRIDRISIMFAQYYKTNGGNIVVELLDDQNLLMRKKIDTKDIKDRHNYDIELENPIVGYKNKKLTLSVFSEDNRDSGIAILANKKTSDPNSRIKMGNLITRGSLCFSTVGSDNSLADDYYWYIMALLGLTMAIVLYVSYRKYCNGRINYIVATLFAVYNYKFLISQLVIRDFKSKYKRSILGVFWSFLNPLLTMTVQFLVFSTFFKADTQNYPVYLLSGVVCFSFFSECTTMCLSSISGNARLITKVYIPKYIFPLSRTISSSVNLAISLVPLLLACIILGVVLKPQALLFFYFLVCLILFSLGIGLFLSALMVYFRDIQFLWTVLIQIWMYATPIFYPAEIVPEKYRFILRINPLYHFIGNARTCLINGISPEPRAYIFCLLFAVLSLAIGAFTFKKTQDNFALYL